MPSGQLVASSYNTGNSASERLNDGRRIFVASNGHHIAILEDASNNLKYSTSPDGVTWSSVGSLYAPGGSTVYGVMVYLSDMLYAFTVDATNHAHLLKWTYTTGSNTFGSVTDVTIASSMLAEALEAAWDASQSVFYVVAIPLSTFTPVQIYAVTTSGTIAATHTTGVGDRLLTLSGLQVVPGATSAITLAYITATPSSAGALHLMPLTYNGTAFTNGVTEIVSSADTYFAATALTNANNLDITYVDSSYRIQALQRTGTNVYSTPVQIAAGINSSFPSHTVTPDGSGGLVLWYSSVAGRSQGEAYVVQRKSGIWGQPSLFEGGDASGYAVPRSASLFTSGKTDVLYDVGTTSPFSVYYASLLLGSAPNTPTSVIPNGFVTTLTPSLAALYTNGTVTDQSSAVEWKVVRTSDSFVMWDSGAISQTVNSGSNLTGTYSAGSNVGDPNFVAPTALSFGVQYQIQARAWDSILLPTQVSSYSTPVTFTPVHGGTVAITSLTSGGSVAGTSSPVTITAPDVQPTVSWTQADGHTADRYQIYVYQADGITLISTTGAQALSPVMTNGGTPQQLADFSVLSLQNSSTYILVVALRDATSLAWSQSPPWTLHTNWAPPGNPTGITATPVPTGGCYNQIAWTNGSSTNSVNVYRKLSGSSPSTAILLSTGLLITAIKDLAPLNTAFDYGIQGVGTLGGTTGIVWAAPCTLGLANGNRGFVFNDLTNPLTVWAPLGISPSGSSDWTTMTNWQLIQQQQIAIPEGRTRYIRDSGKAQAWTAPGRQWEVLDIDTMNGATLLANAYAMVYATASPTLYRDPYGDYRYVLLSGPAEKRYGPASRTLTIDMSEADAVYAPVVA